MDNQNMTIKIDGKSFHCQSCSCNVFTKLEENKFQCNMCKIEYETDYKE